MDRLCLYVYIISIIIFSGCIEQPKLEEDSYRATFNHDGIKNQCTSCHEKYRPTRDHVQEGSCKNCHNSKNDWIQDISYNHRPEKENCDECHSWKRPDSPHIKDLSCIKCHDTKNWKEGLHYDHRDTSESCLDCHKLARPVDTVNPPPLKDKVEGHFGNEDCFNCHISKEKKTVVINLPDDESEPKGPWNYEHSNALNKDVPHCLPCHIKAGKKQHRFWIGFVSFKDGGNCTNCHEKRKSWDH